MTEQQTGIITVEQMQQMALANQATAQELKGMVQIMGDYIMQLDARLRRQEELLQQRVTVSHAQQKQIMAAIRQQARILSDKYSLPLDKCGADLRAAIRKDVLTRCRVKDLHDIPESSLGDVLATVSRWDSFTLVRKLRNKMEA